MTEEEKPNEDQSGINWDFSDLTKHVTADFLILAENVDVENGKMYIHAAGWDSAMCSSFPGRIQWAAGTRLRVPWDATNQPHVLALDVVDADGHTILGEKQHFRLDINVGRPPQYPPGRDQVIPFAFDLANAAFPSVGAFSVVIDIDGRRAAHSTLHVYQGPKQRPIQTTPYS